MDLTRQVLGLFKGLSAKDVMIFTQDLAALLEAGLPLDRALSILIDAAEKEGFKEVVGDILKTVQGGGYLSDALGKHPRIFSTFYVNMVRAGEESGSLDLVLHRLSELTEHQQALRGRVRAALMYPIFMLLIGTLVLFFLITFIVPNITKIFDEMHQVLPLPTLILIGVSGFLKSFWWLVMGGVGGAVLVVRRLIKSPRGRRIWDSMKLRLPVMGSINTKTVMARFARTLGSLLQNGVPLLTALGIVRNVVSNTLVEEVIDGSMAEIQSGKALASSLSTSRWFPPIVIQMISAGEQSGEMETMLNKIADIYEGEVESQALAMTSILEPVMILFMGLTVGFIVVSILLPIFEMNQMIR